VPGPAPRPGPAVREAGPPIHVQEARWRGLRQGLFTEEPGALAGQSGPADDRRDGSGGFVKPRL
jgi:hypothetical protein